MIELMHLLGRGEASPEVVEALRDYSLTEISDAPPHRKYRISRACGINLLFDDDLVIAVQIYVQAIRRYAEFSDALPFGLKKGMSQADVHLLLGAPNKFDAFDSQYELVEEGARLIVVFDGSSVVKYISLESKYATE